MRFLELSSSCLLLPYAGLYDASEMTCILKENATSAEIDDKNICSLFSPSLYSCAKVCMMDLMEIYAMHVPISLKHYASAYYI